MLYVDIYLILKQKVKNGKESVTFFSTLQSLIAKDIGREAL